MERVVSRVAQDGPIWSDDSWISCIVGDLDLVINSRDEIVQIADLSERSVQTWDISEIEVRDPETLRLYPEVDVDLSRTPA